MAETAASVFITSAVWEREVSNDHHSSDRTHVRDLENLVEVQLPDRDRLPIVLRVEKSGDHIPFTPLDQPTLNLCHCPAIERILVHGSKCTALVHSRRQ